MADDLGMPNDGDVAEDIRSHTPPDPRDHDPESPAFIPGND